jgi:hypothetical protein
MVVSNLQPRYLSSDDDDDDDDEASVSRSSEGMCSFCSALNRFIQNLAKASSDSIN